MTRSLQPSPAMDMLLGDDMGGETTGLSGEDSEVVDIDDDELDRAIKATPPHPEYALELEVRRRQARRVLPGLRGSPGASVPHIRSRSAGGGGRGSRKLGRLDDLSERLWSIPLCPGTGDFQDGDPIAEGPDWEVARLDTIIKFLAEEDVDRCIGWEPKFEEIVSYLEWLALEDADSQLDHARPQTQAMFNDAVTKAKAHVLFEQHRYNPTTIEFTKPSKTPFRSTRLGWMVNAQNWPLPSHNPVPNRRNLLPRPILPHIPGPVNRMLIDRPESDRLYNKLAKDQREWWHRIAITRLAVIPPDAENASERDNLAYHEDQAFTAFTRSSSTTPWITTDATGTTILPNNRRVRPGAPVDYAQERGTRRATLQHILRTLPTTPPTIPHHAHLLLPTPAATLRRILTLADNPAWTHPALPPSQLPPQQQLETMPHTIAYRARLAALQKRRERARCAVGDAAAQCGEWRAGGEGGSVAAVGGAGRALLGMVLGLVERGVGGEFVGGWGAPVWLAPDEWDVVEGRRVPRYLDAGEVEWLRFLGGECVNGLNYTGRFLPDTPRDKYRLFQLFAKKVKKLLDDKNPEGLFSSHDASVEVEDLLKAINAGKDSSAVVKHEFKPHDACKWLDRMKDRGYLRFRLDPTCYGVVRRPLCDYFPEHRVIWPRQTPTGDYKRPNYGPDSIADWDTVINEGEEANINEGSDIWEFFQALAFRLGYTISMLEQDRRQHPPQPIPATHLCDSIRAWSRTCARLERTTPPSPTAAPATISPTTAASTAATTSQPTPDELDFIRTQLINELHLNQTMLAPGRAQHYLDASGTHQTILVRDHNWDWAAITAAGRAGEKEKQSKSKKGKKEGKTKTKRRQFWSINRWPVEDGGAGYLTAEAARAVREDAYADPAVGYDPAGVDRTTEWWYLRPKLQRYRQEKVVFRKGPAVYPVGDTRLQREVVRERMVEMVERATGLDMEEPTWGGALMAGLNPFSRSPSRAEDREAEGKLPPVKPGDIPRSWDPVAEAERRAAVQTESDYETEEDIDEEDEVGSVDVPMTGMGGSWIAV
ncbi:hypothetical protein F5144DRAFT_638270 [Chaetomium tenue]|uniref:Uncharacterized protein n=1 Tax=Chaetomium tenue TaxID=1854479 RepID=A0ACB7PSM3_9PEZI|nr:hypothetical protein F5144DRAFT_638270 [Chaetomium globosum]